MLKDQQRNVISQKVPENKEAASVVIWTYSLLFIGIILLGIFLEKLQKREGNQ
jgi:hypothetical protein